MNIPILDIPNWGAYSIHIQAVAWILDCSDVIKGEAKGTTPQTHDLLELPITGAQDTLMLHNMLQQKPLGTKRIPKHLA